jgi:antitoxin (DNA-binding transcriptional repressor) of toxin-antitoxin stability system
VRKGGDFVPRAVELGVRGTARSQVLKGLAPGEEVLLSAGGEADALLTPSDEPEQKPAAAGTDATQEGAAK